MQTTKHNQEKTFFNIKSHKRIQTIGKSGIFHCKYCKNTGTAYEMYDQKCR